MTRGRLYNRPITLLCVRCDSSFEHPRTLRKHLSSPKHKADNLTFIEISSENVIVTSSAEDGGTVVTGSVKRVYPCICCGDAFEDKGALRTHCHGASRVQVVASSNEEFQLQKDLTPQEALQLFISENSGDKLAEEVDVDGLITPPAMDKYLTTRKRELKRKAVGLGIALSKRPAPNASMESSPSTMLSCLLQAVDAEEDCYEKLGNEPANDDACLLYTGDPENDVEAVVTQQASRLMDAVIISESFCILVFAWDVFVTGPIGADACAFIREKRKKTGRSRILGEEHKKVILECIDENPSVVLEQLMERLLQRFQGLKVSKSTVYNFVRMECNLSLKKTHFQPVDRNSEAKIQERLDWVREWEGTDMDFRTNCVFLDESAFHINMKRSMAWSKKGSPAVVAVPKTQAQTTTILGAIFEAMLA